YRPAILPAQQILQQHLERERQACDITQAVPGLRQAVVVIRVLADLQGAATIQAVQGWHGVILGSRATGSALDRPGGPRVPARLTSAAVWAAWVLPSRSACGRGPGSREPGVRPRPGSGVRAPGIRYRCHPDA